MSKVHTRSRRTGANPKPAAAYDGGPYRSVALVLQGGGALGAYQGGVYEELAKAGYDPNWYAGISIGAINAGILAGNPASTRLDRLHEFWDLVTSSLDWPMWLGDSEAARQTYNSLSAATAAATGLPGFFQPRLQSPFMHMPGGQGATSFYDTTPLKATLERLVDFDRINSGHVRLSLGAVNVRNGNYVFFDTTQTRIGPEHIMASAALPPSFPAIEIEGEAYWDGGLVSNTPLFHVLEQSLTEDTLVFEVDLFSHLGPFPRDILEVEERRKDITFSSRTRENTKTYEDKHTLRCAILQLYDKLPPALKQDPDVLRLRAMGDDRLISIVHLIYRSKNFETHEKDYEFSRRSMRDHWEAGRMDMSLTLKRPMWLQKADVGVSLRVFDMTRDPPTEEDVGDAIHKSIASGVTP